MIAAEQIVVDRDAAQAALRKYREHRHYSLPIDHEIVRCYEAIAKGRAVIRALASIAQAGLGEDGLPKLAIVRADAKKCWCDLRSNGWCRFGMKQWHRPNETRQFIDLPAGSFAGAKARMSYHSAIVPLIPLDVRPKRGLQNYHVLFEAIWREEPPIDPLLLRRIGAGDVWLVVAAWELGPIERAVLAGRMRP